LVCDLRVSSPNLYTAGSGSSLAASYHPSVEKRVSRPSRLGGLWTCLAGGLFLAVLLGYLRPVFDPADCPNAGANGNASAFTDPAWDLYLPLLVLGWLLLVAIEQALPTTWRHRSALAVTLRATLAIGVVIAVSCVVVAPLEVVCR
jgi:hypothetical protein